MRGSALRRLAEGIVVCVAYGALATLLLWPLFSDPAHATLDPDRVWLAGWINTEHHEAQTQAILRDMRLAQWIYAWNWHALTTAPRSFYDANMFHPTPHALAYSEHAVGKVVLTGPIFALSGNPVLAYQLDLWLCFALSGAAMYALLRHAGALRAAAFVGGFVYAFCPARTDLLYYTHLLTGQYLPLALLFLDRALFARRARAAVAFAVCLLLHMLCSYYLAYMALIGVPVYALGLLWVGRARVSLRGVLLAGAAFASVLVAFALVSLPYLRVRASGALWDYSQIVQVLFPMSNQPWRSYLWPPLLAANEATRLTRGCYAYLGLIPLALALVALARACRGASVRRRTLVASALLALVSYVLSLGPMTIVLGREVTLPYGWLMRLVPGFSSMRVPGRFALAMMVGFAVLVGLGFDQLLRRAARARPALARWSAGVAAVAASVIALEYGLLGIDVPIRRETIDAARAAGYAALATLPRGAVLEVPFSGRGGLLAIEYGVQSVRHWQPLLNGSSGYNPPTFGPVDAVVRRLPDAAALQLLGRMTDVRYVVVHDGYLTPFERRLWARPPGLELLGTYGSDRLFRVASPPAADLLPAMLQCAADTKACKAIEELVLATGPAAAKSAEAAPR